MMTDESLQVITDADQDTDFEVRVSEVFELRLPAMPTTGHLWEFSERPDEIVIESWHWEPQEGTDPDLVSAPGASNFRVWRLHAAEPGSFVIRLRCWQPWEGVGSIVNTFCVNIEAT